MDRNSESERKVKKAELLVALVYGLPALLAISLWTADVVKKVVKRMR